MYFRRVLEATAACPFLTISLPSLYVQCLCIVNRLPCNLRAREHVAIIARGRHMGIRSCFGYYTAATGH